VGTGLKNEDNLKCAANGVKTGFQLLVLKIQPSRTFSTYFFCDKNTLPA